MIDPMAEAPSPSIPWMPYGALNNLYRLRIAVGLVPPHWMAHEDDREALWLAFRAEVSGEVAARLWPIYDYDARAWRPFDRASMEALTRLDFDLLHDLRAGGQPGSLDQQPEAPGRTPSSPTHRTFFVNEDGRDGRPLGSDYLLAYDSSLSDHRLAAIPLVVRDVVDNKVGSASLQFKRLFQRPRAYQMSVIMGFDDFRWEVGHTSMTPSLSSGHALEGILIAAAAYARFREDGLGDLSPDSIGALQQFGVDIGDRRVMAGIHYPSDNLASWWIALRLSAGIFDDAAVTDFIRDAVISRSAVFRLMSKAADDAVGQPYREMLELITSEA